MTQILSKMESGGSYVIFHLISEFIDRIPKSEPKLPKIEVSKRELCTFEHNLRMIIVHLAIRLFRSNNSAISLFFGNPTSRLPTSYFAALPQRQLREMENYYQRQLGQSSSRV